MKIYTRTGDQGTTGLLGAIRVPKNDVRIATLGSIDELNASLGIARSIGLPVQVHEIVAQLQNQLFRLGAEVATPIQDASNVPQPDAKTLGPADIQALEQAIDVCEQDLPTLQAFILPGGTPAAAQLHLARAICRRAERDLTSLSQQNLISDSLLPLLNRVSDLLFVLARSSNASAGEAEIQWTGS